MIRHYYHLLCIRVVFIALLFGITQNTMTAGQISKNKVTQWINHHPVLASFAGLMGLMSLSGLAILIWKLVPKAAHKKQYLNKRITIGNERCRGAQHAFSQTVTIKQVTVKNQFDDDGGGYESCGYHGLKNGILITNTLNNQETNLADQLHDAQLIKDLFADGTIWGRWRAFAVEQQCIAQNSDIHYDGENLRSDSIDTLIHHELRERILLNKNVQCTINTIDDINIIGQNEFDFITPTVRENLTNARTAQKSYTHIFLIGTMKHQLYEHNKTHKGTIGHWFTVVLHQSSTGPREYIIADSVNAYRLQDPAISTLIQAIEAD